MNMKIRGKIPQDMNLMVKVNQETKMLDDVNQEVLFCINKKGKCEIELEEELVKSNLQPRYIIFNFFTIIIQGILNALLMNVDLEWYENINAYCLNAKLSVDIQQDTEIYLIYTRAKYNENSGIWKKPSLKVVPSFEQNIRYIFNIYDFRNQYVNYIKRFLSVVSILELILIFLFHVAIINANIAAGIFSFSLILGTVVLFIILSFREYKRYKKLYQTCIKQIEYPSELG